LWWYLPVLAFAGLVAAFAIARLPGDLPGVLLAAIASIGLGLSPPGSGRWSRSGWGR
jgi:hypothetical protein